MASKISINLDTSKENFILTKCKQDDDLTLEASIFENGLALELTNKEIFIKALKADNTYINQSTGITKENNKMLADLIRDFSRVPGTTKVEVLLIEGGKQNTTFSFYLEVVGSVTKGAVESSNTVTILEELDNKVLEAKKVKEDTQTFIQNGGAATTGDIAKINSSLEQIGQQFNQAVGAVTSDSEVVLARNSLTKNKTFTVLDDRLEELEKDVKNIVTQEAWITPTLLNGWLNDYNNGYVSIRYMKDRLGFVHIEGGVYNGTSNNNVIFTLPIGYRPNRVMVSNILAPSVRINANGDVLSTTATNSLRFNVIFKPEQ